jgi:hypothetical protein
MRVAYSHKEAVTMIGPPVTLFLLKQWEHTIPPSIFLGHAPYFTRKQITFLKEWFTDQLPWNTNPCAYLLAHWHEPDEEETEER